MSQQNNGTFVRRPQTMFNDFRYPMPKSDKPVEGAKYPATWTWELGLSGQIFMKINDGVWGKDDKNAKSKEVELSWADRNALLNLMEEACNNPNFGKAQYVVRKVTFGNGGRMNDHPSTMGTFTVIRDGQGKIHVGYTKGTYKVMFPFTSPYDSIILVSKDGESVEDNGLMSRVYCKAFINFSRKYLDQYEWDNFKPREKKGGDNNGNNNNRGGGNNSWGGNNNSGGNGGGNSGWGGNNSNSGGGQQTQQRQAPADFDDDIDF
ncbi:hypothetical protein OBP_067 [Pseudomonas phage OBP]|uniref:hypothetical protein n=1 Tax=Pseudomonas phage OBP TaxID=1124849 RepID=UPI000240D421|nr:hypothetical protein OBP_067 [Pseudomonas phage OBP]AEV89504.1 hypothetical protein OBP_067 [Pseudomonas phage OBP]